MEGSRFDIHSMFLNFKEYYEENINLKPYISKINIYIHISILVYGHKKNIKILKRKTTGKMFILSETTNDIYALNLVWED